jgi:hypothetical protein
MLDAAFYIVAVAVLSGILLALLHLRATEPAQWPRWYLGALHGAIGAVGLIAAILVLTEPLGSAKPGVAGFRLYGVITLAVGLVLGGGIPLLWWRRGAPSALLIGVHGTIAVTGFILLAAFRALS